MKTRKNDVIILLLLLLTLYYIWFRFIRERLPRDIPFQLTIFSLVSLIYICFMYIFFILRLVKPKEPNSFILYIFSKASLILQSFLILDNKIKSNKYVKNKYDAFVLNIKNINYHFTLEKYKKKIIFYILLFLFPKLVMVIIFFIDVIYFHKLEIFYTFIFLSLIPLMLNYIIFSIKNTTEQYITLLEKDFMVEILRDNEQKNDYFFSFNSLNFDDDNLLQIRYFIDIQVSSIYFEYTPYKYACVETWEARERYAKEHNIELAPLYIPTNNVDEISRSLSKSFYEIMPVIIDLKLFIEIYTNVQKYSLIRYINIFISIIYLICWLYILCISLHTLDINILLEILNNTWMNILEPFSGITVFNFLPHISYKQVTNIDETILLTGIHTHVVVIYTVQNDKKIVIGYLTSDKSKLSSIKLSDNQPFNYDNSNKEQYFAFLREPMLIVKEEHLKHLSSCVLNDGRVINQQEIGHAYLNDAIIHNKLKQYFKEKFIPMLEKSEGNLEVYTGKGLTMKEIEYALQQQEICCEAYAKERFKIYKKMKNLQNEKKLADWLFTEEKVLDKKTFHILKRKIDAYEDKYK